MRRVAAQKAREVPGPTLPATYPLEAAGGWMQHLGTVELGVEPILREKLGVVTLFDDAAIRKHEDHRRLPDRRQAVGDNKCRAADKEPFQRFLDERFGLCVE